jgi:SAM-dependent methyltransferase
MIDRTLTWIEETNEEHKIQPARILDIGSRDTNGSPRPLFPDSEYTGIDIHEGAGVDIVMDAHMLFKHFDENHFDAVLCLNLLEHATNPWRVMRQIEFVLEDGGYLYVSVPAIGFPYHGSPKDYWRMTEHALRDVIMDGYNILSFEHGASSYGKYPIMDCMGVKIGDR